MKQLPVEIVQMISCYLEPSERKLLLNVSKDFYKIIILDIYKRNELIINIYKSPNFFTYDYNNIKIFINNIQSFNNHKIIEIMDRLFSNTKLKSFHLSGIIMWLKLFKRELVNKSYLQERINNKTIMIWLVTEYNRFISKITDSRDKLVRMKKERLNNILTMFL